VARGHESKVVDATFDRRVADDADVLFFLNAEVIVDDVDDLLVDELAVLARHEDLSHLVGRAAGPWTAPTGTATDEQRDCDPAKSHNGAGPTFRRQAERET
jgi:hypothetical protein